MSECLVDLAPRRVAAPVSGTGGVPDAGATAFAASYDGAALVGAVPRNARPVISCVVPAYNEAANLGPLLHALTRQLMALTDQWEVIVVDDGSADTTAQAMLGWLVRPGVRYLRLSRNFGKEAALTAGIDRAVGEVVLLMDADLQHPASLVPRMLAAWVAGADMVCATRASRADEGLVKRLGTAVFYGLLNRGSAVRVPVDAGDFRLMDRCVVDALRQLPERNRFMKGLYAWVGFHTVAIPYVPDPRHAGRSSFSLGRLVRLAFTGVTSFTNAPLRWWSGIGATIALAALGYGLWIVVEHAIYGVDVPGWATVVAGMMFLSGVQLLSIGMLGEYVGRIFDEVKQRPVYLVGSEAGRGCIAAQPAAQPAAS
jgi:glycosyltransferase involved in cell wall biosynthesis